MTLALALRATPERLVSRGVDNIRSGREQFYCLAVTPASGAALAWLTGRCAGVVKNGRLPRRGSRSVSTRLHATKPEVAFVIGGPGSGKGTQCELVVSELGFQHLSAGELLRQERSRKGSPLAEEIEEAMKAAKPVPSEVIAKLLEQAMREAGVRRSKPWKEHPEEPVDVNFQGSVEDELSQVADWIDSILDPFYTRDVKKNKILWAWQAGVGQKIFHYRFDEAFVLGFYVLDFRTRDGANFVTMELDHFHLQEPEKRRLDEAVGVMGLKVPSLKIGAWAEGPAARFVVDGYPRSAEQLRGYQTELSQKVQLLCCISLEVDREEMRRRLLGRAQSSGRVDDEEEVIEKRLNTFQADTDPLLAFFKAEGLLKEVNGNQAPEQVFQEVRACLEVEADA
ncbi:unnamed protein product [Durusdinium trenchii]|uniref:Adenylate kinase n=1 Tax=Durusdinium trenchii TaxID=1381693 RepID=A0ABP0Q996_9DINO